MEILNNLWMALSMPNEVLINVIAVPAMLIENFLVVLLFSALLKTTLSIKQKTLYVITSSIAGIISMYFIPSPYNIFSNYIIIILLAYFSFKLSFIKTITSIVLSLLIFNLIGGLILNPFITLLDISTEQLSSVPIYRILYSFTMYICTYIIVVILRNRNIKLDFLEYLDKKTSITVFTSVLLGILTIIVQAITLFYYVNTLPLIITFFSFISLLAYFIVSLYSLTRIYKLVLTTKKLESAESYNNSLRILHDNVRGFKHDFDNIVTTIGGYIRTEDMDGLKKYYLELEDDCQRVNTLYILNPDVVNNDGIYNLLTKKYYEADSKDIKVNITFLLDLSTLNMKIYEFARILGILLDNAIEASSECKEKIINLTFRNDTKNSRQLVIVENTYNGKDIDTERIFDKGFSGKEKHSGLGLWEVRKLVKKNNNINLFTSKNDKLFSQQLEIYY